MSTAGRTAAAACTDVGQVRRLNEDRVLAADPVFAVADGMGGHAAGDVAATIVVTRLAELAGTSPSVVDVVHAIEQANVDVLTHGRAHPETAGLGATIAGVCLGDVDGSPHWFVFNVGDARVYAVREDFVAQVTIDHSEVQELVDAGRITPEEARDHPDRNVVTRSVGTDPTPAVDVWVIPAAAGDRFLICSDGLTTELTDESIAGIACLAADCDQMVNALVAAAVERGGHDNVSAVAVELAMDQLERAVDVTAPRRKMDGATHA